MVTEIELLAFIAGILLAQMFAMGYTMGRR